MKCATPIYGALFRFDNISVQKSMVTDPLTDLPTIKLNLQQKITPKLLPKLEKTCNKRLLP